MRQLIAGNWKMNGDPALVAAMADALRRGFACDVLVAPPATLLAAARDAMGAFAAIAGQDCHAEPSGAYTGDLSATMLAEAGASAVILGHSERRDGHHETSAAVRAKTSAALAAALAPIVCVGEHEAARAANHAEALVVGQLMDSLPDHFSGAVAYEPIWAIGTGRACGPDEVGRMHAALREALARRFPGRAIRLLYGGSVKPDNAATLLALPEVDGALVGGASLDPAAFAAIAGFARPSAAG